MHKTLALFVDVKKGITWEVPFPDNVDTESDNEELLRVVQGLGWKELFPDEPPKDWQNLKMEVRTYE